MLFSFLKGQTVFCASFMYDAVSLHFRFTLSYTYSYFLVELISFSYHSLFNSYCESPNHWSKKDGWCTLDNLRLILLKFTLVDEYLHGFLYFQFFV